MASSRVGMGRSGFRAAGMMNFFAPAHQMPLPPRFRTTFHVEGDYKVAIATATTFNGLLRANNPQTPFFPGSSAFPSLTFLGPSTESTLNPTFMSVLFTASVYNTCRVIFSNISVKLSSSSSDNNMFCVIVPTTDFANPNDIYAARTQPWARYGVFNTGKPDEGCQRDGFLHSNLDCGKFLGMSKLQRDADLFYNVASVNTPPQVEVFWKIFCGLVDQDVTANSACTLQVRVKYTVELFNQTLAAGAETLSMGVLSLSDEQK